MSATGKTYVLNTVADVICAYAELPEDRQEGLLSELCRAVRYGAAFRSIMGGGNPGPLQWTDDDLNEATVTATAGGQELFRLETRPRSEGDASGEQP